MTKNKLAQALPSYHVPVPVKNLSGHIREPSRRVKLYPVHPQDNLPPFNPLLRRGSHDEMMPILLSCALSRSSCSIRALSRSSCSMRSPVSSHCSTRMHATELRHAGEVPEDSLASWAFSRSSRSAEGADLSNFARKVRCICPTNIHKHTFISATRDNATTDARREGAVAHRSEAETCSSSSWCRLLASWLERVGSSTIVCCFSSITSAARLSRFCPRPLGFLLGAAGWGWGCWRRFDPCPWWCA
jgi:hypothetical protein